MAKNKTINMVKSQVIYKDYSKDAERTALISGENLAHMFGKIARWYTDISWVGHKHVVADITDFPALGTAASKDVPASGDAENNEVVMGNDSRLTDARTPTTHTHTEADISDLGTYAGASTKGGAATSANKLNIGSTDIGSETKPVYFNATTGKPVACAYSLKASVPANAVFTDVNVKQTPSTVNESREVLFAGNTGNTETTGTVGKSNKLYFNPNTGALTATSFSGSVAASNLTGTIDAGRLPTTSVTAGSYGPAAGGTLAHGGTFDAAYVTVDKYGRLTAASTKTFTLPAQYVHPSYTSKTSGLYKITVDSLGHVSDTAAVTASDLPSHTHQYAKSSSINGPAYSVEGWEGTDAIYRHVWFSTSTDETRRAYNDNFMYSPTQGTLKFTGWIPVDLTSKTADLNTYNDSTGVYRYRRYICTTTGGGSNISNKAVDAPFVLEVILIRWASTTDYITKQIYHGFDKKTYQRFCTNGTWSAWTEQKYTDTVYTHPTHTQKSSGLYKITVDNLGHVSGTAAVTASDLPSHTHPYLPLTGGTMTGAITFQVADAIKYNASSTTTNMISFITGASDGHGVRIGGGGLVVIGSGESSTALVSSLSLTGNTEQTYIASDNNITLYSKCQTIGERLGIVYDNSGRLRPDTDNTRTLGGTDFYWNKAYITQVVGRGTGGSWILSRDNAIVRQSSMSTNSAYFPVISAKTKIGEWSVGTLGPSSEHFYFSYTLDTNYSAGTNTSKTYYISTDGWFNGTAAKADAWSTARTLTLTGSVTGSASIDGSGNVSLATTTNHTHSQYLPLAGGTMTGDINFTAATSTEYPAKSKQIYFSGSTDWAKIYYQVDASDAGRLVFDIGDDTNTRIVFANSGTAKSYIDANGNFSGNAATATTAASATSATTASKLGTNGGSAIQPVYFSGGVPVACNKYASGAYFNIIPYVSSDGVMEIGRYVDFHNTAASTADYNYRLDCQGAGVLVSNAGSSNNVFRLLSSGYNQIQFQTTATDKAYTAAGIMVNPLSTSGSTMRIQSGGNMIIGAGESPTTVYSNDFRSCATSEGEILLLTADGTISMVTGVNTYDNRKEVLIDASGNIRLGNSQKLVQYQNSGSNYTCAIKWWTNSTDPGNYGPEIGQHNTGDTDGSICILPYHTTSSPWEGNVGLYISKTRLRYNGTAVSLDGHTHSYAGSSSAGGSATRAVNSDNCKVTVTDPSSATNYGILFVADPNTTEDNMLRKSNNFRVKHFVGAANTEGKTELIIGNAVAKTAANNCSGFIYLYNSNGKNACLKPNTNSSDITLTLPSATGTLALVGDNNHTHSYAGSSSAGGAATSANKLNTNAGTATNPVYFSGGVPTACTYSLQRTVLPNYSVNSGNTTNYPYHLLCSMKDTTAGYKDYWAVFRVTPGYHGQYSGVYKVAVRMNNGNASSVSVNLLSGYPYLNDVAKVVAGYSTSGTNTYLYVFLVCPTYARTTVSLLQNGNFTFYSSNEVDNTTTSDKKTSVNVYATLAAAGTALVGGSFASTITSITVTNYANIVSTAVTDPSSSTSYGILFAETPNTSQCNYIRKSNDFRINHFRGAANTEGLTEIVLGNSTASTAANNSTGRVTVYNAKGAATQIVGNTNTSTVIITLPSSTGTLALTGHTHSYIPLSGSTAITGELRVTMGETAMPTIDVSNGTYRIGIHVGSGGVNHGIYDFSTGINTWMCYHNGTEFLFNGKANTAGKWATARTLTIGSTGKSVDGSGNVSWSLSEIGAAPASHSHDYIGAKSDGTYWGMASPSLTDNVWIRTTTQGIIPYQSGGRTDSHSGLGTSSWYFTNAYVRNVYTEYIAFNGTKASHTMIRFLDNTTSTDGDGILIGGGGVVCIGAGESAGALYNASEFGPSNEQLYLASDNNVYFYTNCNTIANKVLSTIDTSGRYIGNEIIGTNANGLRIAYGGYGFFIRNDGSNTYFMFTDKKTDGTEKTASYNGLRPLYINNSTGRVTMGNGVTIYSSDFGPLTIKRSGSTNGAGIKFYNVNGSTDVMLGAIGMSGSANGGLLRWTADLQTSYKILDTGNTSISQSLSSGTKIATITIGGTATDLYCQTNTNTDTLVTQTNTTADGQYRVVLSGTNDDTTRTETARKSVNLRFNPGTSRLFLRGATTASVAYGSTNPAIRFENSNASQNIELILNDFDSICKPASLAMIGNQGDESFLAPNIVMWDFTNNKEIGSLSTIMIGTTSKDGLAALVLGNKIASGTAGNASGHIELYNDLGGLTMIAPSPSVQNTPTGQSSITLPPVGGAMGDSVYWTKNYAQGSTRNERLRANRFAFIATAGITIEHTKNSGSSWTTATASNVIFCAGGTNINIGGYTTDTATSAYKTRITVDAAKAGVYSELDAFCFEVTTNGSSGCTVLIEYYTTGNAWAEWQPKKAISGWSGLNYFSVDAKTFGSSHPARKVRFTFEITGQNTQYQGLQIMRIWAYGGMGWTTPSTLAKNDHLYSFDNSQNATFPANVSATKFIGALEGNVKTTVTDPSSETTYAVVFESTPGTTGNYALCKSNDFRVNHFRGAANTEGKSELILGNSTASTAANNASGFVSMYNKKGNWTQFKPSATSTANITVLLPSTGGTMTDIVYKPTSAYSSLTSLFSGSTTITSGLQKTAITLSNHFNGYKYILITIKYNSSPATYAELMVPAYNDIWLNDTVSSDPGGANSGAASSYTSTDLVGVYYTSSTKQLTFNCRNSMIVYAVRGCYGG